MKKMKKIFVNAWACLLLVMAIGGFSSCNLGGEEINSYIYNGTKYVTFTMEQNIIPSSRKGNK